MKKRYWGAGLLSRVAAATAVNFYRFYKERDEAEKADLESWMCTAREYCTNQKTTLEFLEATAQIMDIRQAKASGLFVSEELRDWRDTHSAINTMWNAAQALITECKKWGSADPEKDAERILLSADPRGMSPLVQAVGFIANSFVDRIVAKRMWVCGDTKTSREQWAGETKMLLMNTVYCRADLAAETQSGFIPVSRAIYVLKLSRK